MFKTKVAGGKETLRKYGAFIGFVDRVLASLTESLSEQCARIAGKSTESGEVTHGRRFIVVVLVHRLDIVYA